MMSAMREASARREARTAPALLMLLLVTAGLFTMHTLGHFSMPAGMTSASHTATAVDAHPMDRGGAHATPDMQGALAEMPALPQMPMGSAVACVAILCALIVLAVVVALAHRVRVGRRALPVALRLIVDAGRGPPTVLIGLRLADLSVARH